MSCRTSASIPVLALIGMLLGCSGGGTPPVGSAGGKGPGEGSAAQGLAAEGYAPGAASGPARSFVLITLDTTRPDHLSPYGDREAETPSLEVLARSGTVFERAFATAPVTLPAHTSLMTGLNPPKHGVRNNGTHYLADDIPTLAEELRDRGLATAAFVSAAVLEARYGLARGFAVYDDDLSRGKPKELRMIAERRAQATVDAALAWLDASTAEGGPGEGRFFLWVHLFDPHAAYEPPPPWSERFADRPYDGEIAYMDSQIGRLLADPRIADPRTLVMAVGDHGESLGEHGEASHAMLAYDATLHIPWIVRGPGVVPGGRLAIPVSQIDLFPTVLDLVGAGSELARLELPGRDLAPELEGNRGEPPAPSRDLYAETLVPFYTYGWAKLRTLRRDGWKYIDAPAPELYRVTEDPGELDNRIGGEPERAAEMARRLGQIESADRSSARAETVRPLDRESREKLRSLGYLGAATGGGTIRPDGDRPNGERPDPKAMIELHRTMDRAEHLLYARDFEAAVSELRRVLVRDPANRAALIDLAKALGELGRPEPAAEAIHRALALDPSDPDLHLTLAGLDLARGRPEAALKALDAALALDPRSLDAKVEKARVLLRVDPEHDRPEAVALLESVLEEEPHHARANVLWAREVEAERGDLAAAESRLLAVTAREPYLAEGWQELGRVRERSGRPSEAEAAYRRGLELQPRDPGLHALLGLLLVEEGNVAAALPELEQAEKDSPSPPPEVMDGRAAVAVARRQWTEAESEARHALERDPRMASAWNHLAVALEEQGRTAEALDAYARARSVAPGYWQALFNRGLLLRKLGREEEAIEAFRRVLEEHPDHAPSHYELGVLYGARGEAALAREHLEAALQADPESPRAAQIRRLLAALGE